MLGREVTTGHKLANCGRKELSWNQTRNLSAVRRLCRLVAHQRWTLTSTRSFYKYFAGRAANGSEPSVLVPVWSFICLMTIPQVQRTRRQERSYRGRELLHANILPSRRCSGLRVTVVSNGTFLLIKTNACFDDDAIYCRPAAQKLTAFAGTRLFHRHTSRDIDQGTFHADLLLNLTAGRHAAFRLF